MILVILYLFNLLVISEVSDFLNVLTWCKKASVLSLKRQKSKPLCHPQNLDLNYRIDIYVEEVLCKSIEACSFVMQISVLVQVSRDALVRSWSCAEAEAFGKHPLLLFMREIVSALRAGLQRPPAVLILDVIDSSQRPVYVLFPETGWPGLVN